MNFTAHRHRAPRYALFLLAAASFAVAASGLGPEQQAALDRISADSLRGHVSFLASDLLEGRNTPSPGLDVAAEYIAAQFRRAGLEPAGDNGYFETANFVNATPNYDGFELAIETGGATIRVAKENVALSPPAAPVHIVGAGVTKVPMTADAGKLAASDVAGKVVLTAGPDFRALDADGRRKAFGAMRAFRDTMSKLKPAAVIALSNRAARSGAAAPRLVDPATVETRIAELRVNDAALAKAYDGMPSGAVDARATVKAASAIQAPLKLKNVAGILRGSDPKLKDTYVLVTAHYDHVGMGGTGGDRIYNGANDDASGVASVIELASTLSKMKQRPRRSLLFMTYFGEEEGLLGSAYYGRHPLVPLSRTVADINLEQLGRTDDTAGPQIARASLTGFDYTDIGPIFRKAGELTGITVFKNEKNSDPYFARSDNQALADVGIPAHTLVVAYDFPDYHRPGDEWQKLDYANMAKVDRMVALGLLMIADNADAPKWNAANPLAERYAQASKARRGD